MRRFIISTLVLIGTLLLAYFMEGGNPLDLILPSPLIIVVCMPICAVLAVWGFKDWGRAWKDAFIAGCVDGATSTAASSAKLWDFYEKACYIAGIVGFILGLTIIGRNSYQMADPMTKLGPYFAVDCVTPIIAILFAMVARILRARVEKNAA
jgi:hypothetical protein